MHTLLALAVVALTPPATAADLYVDDDGDDSGNDCETMATPCATIEHALDQLLAPGDVIHLASGSYSTSGAFPLTIANGVSLSGDGRTSTFVGPATGSTSMLLAYSDHTDPTTVKALTLRNGATGVRIDHGVAGTASHAFSDVALSGGDTAVIARASGSGTRSTRLVAVRGGGWLGVDVQVQVEVEVEVDRRPETAENGDS